MENAEEKLARAISESFKQYKEKGARSPEKLKPLHKFIADLLTEVWGKEFGVSFMGEKIKELNVKGKYYPKDIDITITQAGKPVFCVGIKFVTSNYKQNANNYFESMMGETANIQAATIPYAHLIILRHQTPYYRKDGTVKKIETITQSDLQKYINLVYDMKQAHRPIATAICLTNIDEQTDRAKILSAEKLYEKSFARLFNAKLSFSNFISELEAYRDFYISQQNLAR